MAVMGTSQEGNGNLHTPYENEGERLRHLKSIETVAWRIGASTEEVKTLYEVVLKSFKRNARVKDFLPILVSKKVEYELGVRKDRSHR